MISSFTVYSCAQLTLTATALRRATERCGGRASWAGVLSEQSCWPWRIYGRKHRASTEAAPPVGGKTIKVKNTMLHKDSMKLEPVEEGAKQGITFTFDAEITGEAQIFWDCVDMTVPEVLQDPKQLQELGLDLQREGQRQAQMKFPV